VAIFNYFYAIFFDDSVPLQPKLYIIAKGIFGGMTDYNQEPFDDILMDISEEYIRTSGFRDEIKGALTAMNTSG